MGEGDLGPLYLVYLRQIGIEGDPPEVISVPVDHITESGHLLLLRAVITRSGDL